MATVLSPLTQQTRLYTELVHPYITGITRATESIVIRHNCNRPALERTVIARTAYPDALNYELNKVIEMLADKGLYGDAKTLGQTLTTNKIIYGNFIDTTRKVLEYRVDQALFSFICSCSNFVTKIVVYSKEHLNNHLAESSKGIRILDENYKQIFTVNDGEAIDILDKYTGEVILTTPPLRYLTTDYFAYGSDHTDYTSFSFACKLAKENRIASKLYGPWAHI